MGTFLPHPPGSPIGALASQLLASAGAPGSAPSQWSDGLRRPASGLARAWVAGLPMHVCTDADSGAGRRPESRVWGLVALGVRKSSYVRACVRVCFSYRRPWQGRSLLLLISNVLRANDFLLEMSLGQVNRSVPTHAGALFSDAVLTFSDGNLLFSYLDVDVRWF